MIGVYKYDDCKVKNPTVTLVDLSKYFATDSTELIVRMEGENLGHVDGGIDGCYILLTDDGSMPPVTNEAALLSWVEKQLKKYEV